MSAWERDKANWTHPAKSHNKRDGMITSYDGVYEVGIWLWFHNKKQTVLKEEEPGDYHYCCWLIWAKRGRKKETAEWDGSGGSLWLLFFFKLKNALLLWLLWWTKDWGIAGGGCFFFLWPWVTTLVMCLRCDHWSIFRLFFGGGLIFMEERRREGQNSETVHFFPLIYERAMSSLVAVILRTERVRWW